MAHRPEAERGMSNCVKQLFVCWISECVGSTGKRIKPVWQATLFLPDAHNKQFGALLLQFFCLSEDFGGDLSHGWINEDDSDFASAETGVYIVICSGVEIAPYLANDFGETGNINVRCDTALDVEAIFVH